MSRVLFSVWLSTQGIIQNTTCSVWFRIQRITKKCPGYYSASDSVFSVLFVVLFKIRLAYYSASGTGFRVLLKNVQGIIQRLVQYSAYYSGNIQNTTSVLYSAWFRTQGIIQKISRVLFSVWIIKKWLGYYSVSGSVFSMLACLRFQRTQLKLMFMLHVLFYLASAINS